MSTMLRLSHFFICRKRYYRVEGVFISALEHCNKQFFMLSRLSDFCGLYCTNHYLEQWSLINNLSIFRDKVLNLRLKSVCALDMYIHWTCLNINRKVFMLE